MRINNFFKLIIAVSVSELVGVIGSVFIFPSIQGWYANLAKPEFAPPNWIFGPVWTTLFALMGISFFIVWKNHSLIRANKRMVKIWKIGVGFFILQLALNMLWSIIFFGLRSPGGALVEIVFLWFAILATIIAFAKISKPAAWLLMPYILWVSFAGYLNYSIWRLNKVGGVYCTLEARRCSDGSVVGRTEPGCEFAPCPGDTNSSGIRGTALLGPICPVERIPPDPACVPKPYETNLVLTPTDQSRVITEFSSDANGRFEVKTQPGEYAIHSATATNILPYCASDGAVRVNVNSYTEITVNCDTGIR